MDVNFLNFPDGTEYIECQTKSTFNQPSAETNEYDPNTNFMCKPGYAIDVRHAYYGRDNSQTCNRRFAHFFHFFNPTRLNFIQN